MKPSELRGKNGEELQKELEGLLRRGPAHAEVDALEIMDLPPAAVERGGFDIR